MELNQYSSIFWDFGGVITSSPFEAFNKFEIENNLPVNFLRKVNSTNPQNNAWALLEQSKINQMEFNELFFKESSELGYGIEGLKVLNLFENIGSGNHLSAEEVHGELVKSSSKVSLATIYRTLRLLVHMGLLHN